MKITYRYFLSTLRHRMSFSIRRQVICFILWPFPFEKKSQALLKTLRHSKQTTRPRSEIPWFPSISSEKCTGCGLCKTFCPKQVFAQAQSTDRHPPMQVVQPYACVLLCKGCESRCPAQAITFPSEKDFRSFVYYIH